MKRLMVKLLLLVLLIVGMLSLSLFFGKRKPDADFLLDAAIWLMLFLLAFGWGWVRADRPALSVKWALFASVLASVGAAGAIALWYFGWWTNTVAAPSLVVAVLLVALAVTWDPVLAERRQRRKTKPPARAFEVVQPTGGDE